MRIVFICGSLAKGQDGVGDYTYALAEEAIKLGHECLLLSLRDSQRESSQLSASLRIERFQSVFNKDASQPLVDALIDEWKPDYLSLQFVPFAYNDRGLISKLIPLISQLRASCKLEIMFHELWIGEKPSLSFKHKCLGWLQRHYILKALKQWQPQCIHTSNPLYQSMLARYGYAAELLPLFGNMPICAVDHEALAKQLPEYPLRDDERLVLFPFTQSAEWEVSATLAYLKAAAEIADVRLRCVQVGKNTHGMTHWSTIQAFAKNCDWGCDVLGVQSASTLSQLMQVANLGVSSSNIQLAGKSGGIISMLEHGLPVLCTGMKPESTHFIPKMEESRLFCMTEDNDGIAQLLKEDTKPEPISRVPAVARQWMTRLTAI